MPNAGTAEIYFITAMMILILVISAAAVYFFFRQYNLEKKKTPKNIKNAQENKTEK